MPGHPDTQTSLINNSSSIKAITSVYVVVQGRHARTLASPSGPDPVFPFPLVQCEGGVACPLLLPCLTAVHFGPQSLIQHRDVLSAADMDCTATMGGCSAWQVAVASGFFCPRIRRWLRRCVFCCLCGAAARSGGCKSKGGGKQGRKWVRYQHQQ